MMGKAADRGQFPTIVCLCGSGRFSKAFDRAEYEETLKGNIVLTIGCNTKDIARDSELEKHKPTLDELHLRKIDLADEVLILNVSGYIGESTARELVHARLSGKKVRFLEPHNRKMERLVLAKGEEGSYVFNAKLEDLEDTLRIFIEEGGNGADLNMTIYELEEGMYERLPLD